MPNPRVVIEIVSTGRERVAAEIRQLQRDASAATGAQSRFAQTTGMAGRAAAGEARDIAAARRELGLLRASIGDVERVTLRRQRAEEQLNRAVEAGLVDQKEAERLHKAIADTFNVEADRAEKLSRQMSSLNREAGRVRSTIEGLAAAFATTGRVAININEGTGGAFFNTLLFGGALAARRFGINAPARVLGIRAGLGGGLAVGGAALGAVGGTAGLALAGESIQMREAQIRAIGGTVEAVDELVRKSLELGIAVDGNIDLFRRLTIANDTLKKSDQELVAFTQRLNQAILASGTSSDEARFGIIQLGQALASGRLQGDEFRSIMEQIPIVARAIARGLVEMGVATTGSIGELRKLSTQGELTSERIFEAFMRGSRDLESTFEDLPQTTGRSLRIIKDSIAEVAGGIGNVTGLTIAWQFVFEKVADAARAAALAMQDFEPGIPLTMQPGFDLGQRLVDAPRTPIEAVRRELAAARQRVEDLREASNEMMGFLYTGLDEQIAVEEENIARLEDLERRIIEQLTERLRQRAEAFLGSRGGPGGEIFFPGPEPRQGPGGMIVDVAPGAVGRPRPPAAVPQLKPLDDALAAVRISAFNAAEQERKLASARDRTAASTARAIAPAPMSAATARNLQAMGAALPPSMRTGDFGLDVVSVHGVNPPADFTTSLDQLRQMSQEQSRLNAAIDETPDKIEQVTIAYDLALDTSRMFAESAASGLTEAAFSAKSFGDAMQEAALSLAKSVTQALLFRAIMAGIGGPASGVPGQEGFAPATGLIGALFGSSAGAGAQHGLSMVVPGSGPPDSRLFMSRVSPGEHIQITPAADLNRQAAALSRMAAQSSSSSPQVKVEIYNQAPGVQVEQGPAEMENGVVVLRQFIRAEAEATLQRSFRDGRMSSQMAAFGARRAPIRR